MCQCKTRRNVLRTARRASPLGFLSYASQRLLSYTTLKYFPELRPYLRYFGSGSHAMWVRELNIHNEILRRGHRQRLCPTIRTSKFQIHDLDQYLLRMHSDKLVEALQGLVVFAHRVIPVILSDEDAPVWWLNKHILVQRRHWCSLCQRVMALISLVLENLEETDNFDDPGRDRLHAVACRAARIFGAFETNYRTGNC